MSRWAGAEDDWVQKMIRDPPEKEDVIVVLKMVRQLTAHLERKPGGIPSKEWRDLDPLVLDPSTNTKGIDQEGQQDGCGVDQWQGEAKDDSWSTLIAQKS